jgi:hypothetical protein
VVAPTPADKRSRPRATPVREPAKPARVAPGAEAAPDGPYAGADDRLMFAADDLLSLDDWASPSPSEARTELVPAWRCGLRG